MSEKRIVKGYSPFIWQAVVHKAISEAGPRAGKIFVVKSPRQVGKSMIIMMELLRHAINYPGSESVCVTLTFRNCAKIYKELCNGIRNSGLVKNMNNAVMEIEFINGSVIGFKSCAQRESLRGYTIKRGGILAIDECAYIPDDIFAIIFPWVSVNNANILMTSTPRIKSGTFYDYYMEGLDENNQNVMSFDLCEYDTSRMLSKDKIETYRKLMPHGQFITEILGQFADDMGGVFDMSKKEIWIKACVPSSMISKPEEYSELFLGLDWGSGQNGDYTCLSGFDATGTQHILTYFNSLTPTVQINKIKQLFVERIDMKKVKALVCETNSIGRIYIDMLRKEIPNIPIIEFNTSNSSKRDIIEYMIKRFNEGTMRLINNKEQYTEFSCYMMEITPSGSITYNGRSAHDDLVMAAAFALSELLKLEQSSQYSISFGHRKK